MHMLTIMASLLVKLVMLLGVAALSAIIVTVAHIGLKKLLGEIRNYLSQKVGHKVFVGSIKGLVKEIHERAEREGNVKNVNDLLAQLEGEGIVQAHLDENGDAIEDSIKVVKTDEMDPMLDKMLTENKGELVIEG